MLQTIRFYRAERIAASGAQQGGTDLSRPAGGG
jgi:hypothetical protein